jgi:hypothetical protein
MSSGEQLVEGVFRITYPDSTGNFSERVIEQCRRSGRRGHEVIHAFCRLRGATRSFRVDQIVRIVDEQTGEILSSIGEPAPMVETEGSRDDEPSRDRQLNWTPDLNVLTFVASLSSKMRESQVTTIAEYLAANIDSSRDWARIVKRHKPPNPEDFRQAFKHVPRQRGEALMEAARAVLKKVNRDGDLDRGVMAMAQVRMTFIGKYVED